MPRLFVATAYKVCTSEPANDRLESRKTAAFAQRIFEGKRRRWVSRDRWTAATRDRHLRDRAKFRGTMVTDRFGVRSLRSPLSSRISCRKTSSNFYFCGPDGIATKQSKRFVRSSRWPRKRGCTSNSGVMKFISAT